MTTQKDSTQAGFPPPGYHVTAIAKTAVLDFPNYDGGNQVSDVYPGGSYPAYCWTETDKTGYVTYDGVTSHVWIALALRSGDVGFVPAVYLKGDAHADIETRCRDN